MSRNALLLPGLVMTGAALAATLMGCGGHVPPSADRPAAGQAAATGPARLVPASSSPRLAARAANGTRVSAPAASAVDTQPAAPDPAPSSKTRHVAKPSSAPTSDAPRPSPSPRGTGTLLADGLYTDAGDGLPHYVLAFSLGKGDIITGSANFLYQDGRVGFVGVYTGALSGNGKLTLTFGDGKDLTGSYAAGTFTFVGCRVVLPFAGVSGCTFSYHGHVP
jgi:prepilin-type processing-associated H-X9-DG protein